jgi:hypothetical protein
MGYYTGSGVITGGDISRNIFDSVNVQNTLMREQETLRRTTVKNGVSLATAQAATPTSAYKSMNLSAGSWEWATPNASGKKTNYSYSQINGSNLYTLVEQYEQYRKRMAYRNTSSSDMTWGDWAALPA